MVSCRRRSYLRWYPNRPLTRKVHHAIVLAFFLVFNISQVVSKFKVPSFLWQKTHEMSLEASGEGRSHPDRVYVVCQQGV